MKISDEAREALMGGCIEGVTVIKGEPGGANNDCVRLALASGEVVSFDSYAMSGLVVKIRRPVSAVPFCTEGEGGKIRSR